LAPVAVRHAPGSSASPATRREAGMSSAPRSIKETGGDRAFSVFNYLILIFVLVVVAYPLIYVVSASFSDARAVISGRVWLWPVDVTLDGYEAILRHDLLVRSFLNSVFYTVAGAAVSTTLTILAAYPLSRKDLYGRNVIMFLFFFTLLFNGGLIPTYLVVKELGMLNTRWAMILPAALSVYNMIITRTYFQTAIPDELLDAAKIDGASDFRFLRDVVIPLSGPIIAVNALFYGVAQWNRFFDALLYLTDQNLWPLQLVLREILIQNQFSAEMMPDIQELARRMNLRELLKYSLIVVATVPLLIVYPFVQKHFVKGALIGSIKG
jgi:multiple sugar transport system permease protein/putative aldouronate transport system permease protein